METVFLYAELRKGFLILMSPENAQQKSVEWQRNQVLISILIFCDAQADMRSIEWRNVIEKQYELRKLFDTVIFYSFFLTRRVLQNPCVVHVVSERSRSALFGYYFRWDTSSLKTNLRQHTFVQIARREKSSEKSVFKKFP